MGEDDGKAWEPVDWIVLILAVAVGFGMLITVLVPLVLGQPITDARSKILSATVAAVVSVVSVYVGARIRANRRDK